MILFQLLKILRKNLLLTILLPVSLLTTSCGLIGAGVGTAIALAPLKVLLSCLPEGTQIDTPDGPKNVEALIAGDMVIGFEGSPVKVLQIHSYAEDDSKKSFVKVEFLDGTQVDLCKLHRIGGIRAGDLRIGQRLQSGHVVKSISDYGDVERSYDILTEDDGYRIGGVPVNSMIEEMYETGRNGGKIRD